MQCSMLLLLTTIVVITAAYNKVYLTSNKTKSVLLLYAFVGDMQSSKMIG